MAMVILVALMLLGLPFLFSQSTGPAGARSAAHRQLADAARAYAEAAAVDLAGQGFSASITPPTIPSPTDPPLGWFRLADRLNQVARMPQIADSMAIYSSSDQIPAQIVAATVVYEPPISDDTTKGLHIAQVFLPNLKDPTDRNLDAVDRTVATARITDLSGRLDPNFMSVAVWDALLKKVGIDDWDDGDGDVVAWDASKGWRAVKKRSKNTIGGVVEATTAWNGTQWQLENSAAENTKTLDTHDLTIDKYNANGQAVRYIDNDDDDHYGQLAKALGDFAANNRITNIFQLLAADPGHHSEANATWTNRLALVWQREDPDPTLQGPAPPPSPNLDNQNDWVKEPRFANVYLGFLGLNPLLPEYVPPPPAGFGFRGPLTLTELERLRPFLAIGNPAQGRGGCTDAGTMVAEYNSGATYQRFIDADLNEIVGTGTMLIGFSNPNFQVLAKDIIARSPTSKHRFFLDAPTSTPDTRLLATTPMLLRLPPALNWNAADEVTRFAVVSNIIGAARERGNRSVITPPPDLGSGPLTSLDQLRRVLITEDPEPSVAITARTWSLFTFLDPLASPINSQSANSIFTPLTSRVETPPIDIVGTSVFRIDSTGIIYDRSANVPTAQAGASRIWQAVQQENALIERRWDTQAKMHQLIVQRHGSRLAAGPNGYRRVEPDLNETDPAKLKTMWPGMGPVAAGSPDVPWLAPKTLPTLATGVLNRFSTAIPSLSNSNVRATHLYIDWCRDFGAEVPLPPSGPLADPTADRGGNGAAAPINRIWDHADLTAEGLFLNRELRYDLRPLGVANPVPAGALLGSRHLGFWIRPKEDWTNRIVTLFDAHTDMTLLGTDTHGGHSIKPEQNLIRLVYSGSPQKPLLSLSFVSPAIPAIEISSVYTSGDSTQSDPDGIDLRSQAGTATRWHVQPWPDPISRVPFPWGTTTLYQMPHPLTADQWTQIQVVWTGTSPGQSTIIVDGLVGRDVLAAQTTMTQAGDHLTVSALPLASDILAIPIPATRILQPPLPTPPSPPYWEPLGEYNTWFSNLLLPTDITVIPVENLNADDLFPKRGVIRIDDEYFSYEDLEGNTFKNCRRAVRQATNRVDPPPNSATDSRFPMTQNHVKGALVRPGGVSVPEFGGSIVETGHFLYPGGCSLKCALPASDLTSFKLKVTSGTLTIPLDGTASVTLVDASGVPTPGGGIISLNGIYCSYDGVTAEGKLTNLRGITSKENNLEHWKAVPAFTPVPGLAHLSAPPNITITDGDQVTLSGLEITGDPTGKYPDFADDLIPNAGHNLSDHLLVQVADPGDPSAIEWIQYQQFLVPGTNPTDSRSFVFHRLGFTFSSRAQQRTGIRPAKPNAELLPVQATSGLGSWATYRHLVMSGDVLTLVPKDATGTPHQVVVRYATQYSTFNTNDDVVVGLFALDSTLSARFDLSQYRVLIGSGGGGRDLSPVSAISVPDDAMPRIDRFIATNGGTSPTCVFLSDHPIGDAIVDGMIAGTPFKTSINPTIKLILSAPDPNSQNNGDIPNIPIGISGISTVVISDTSETFSKPMGLVSIGGEVFAYRQGSTDDLPAPIFYPPITPPETIGGIVRKRRDAVQPASPNTQIGVLIGRSLLGSKPPTNPIAIGGIIFPIPLGPVAILADRKNDPNNPVSDPGVWYRLDGGTGASPLFVVNPDITVVPDSRNPDLNNPNAFVQQNFPMGLAQWDAPASLVCGRNGGNPRVVQFVGPRTYQRQAPKWMSELTPPRWDPQGGWASFSDFTIANWMLGLYNSITDEPIATDGPQPGDFVIGWWPRYPSALPEDSTCTPAHFRCRTYAWAGFPLRYSDSWFSLGSAEATVLDAADFNVLFRAMSSGVDWKTGITASTEAKNAFLPANNSAFDFPVDGAELRVTWHYKDPRTSVLSDIAANGNRAPRIGPVILRCRAPTQILDTETSR